jgi:hypothetical protein
MPPPITVLPSWVPVTCSVIAAVRVGAVLSSPAYSD